MSISLAALMLLALALCAGEGAAATAIDLGPTDEGPNLAIDAAGAASLTWTSSDVLDYCRLDPGAGACSASHVFPEVSGFASDEGNAPLIAGSSVDVISARFKSEEDKFLYSSTNGFSTANTVGTTVGAPGSSMVFSQALYAPAGSLNTSLPTIPTILGEIASEGAVFQATNTTGTSVGSLILSRTPANTPETTESAGIALQGKTLIGAYTLANTGEIEWRRYIGPASSTPANLDTNSNWSAQSFLAHGDGAMAMTSGPSGIYVAYDRPGDDVVVLQRFNELADGWEAATVATEPGIKVFGISEDPSGVVHIAFVNQLAGEGVLHYTYGRDPGNTAFTNPQSPATGTIRDPEVATTAAGTGWVTWEDSDDGHAMAIPIVPGEPTPPPPASTPPPAPPSAGSGGSKKKGAGATKTTTKSLAPGLGATLSTPKECIGGGSAFKAKVAVKKKGSKAKKLSYTVKQVAFSVAGKLILTDIKKPFEATLHSGRRAGASIPVAAKISVKLKKGDPHTSVTKTLTATVTSCK